MIKTMKAHQNGAIKLARLHGERLVCVRYRQDPQGWERLTTVELIVERAVIQKRRPMIVAFKIRPDEVALQEVARSRGAVYDRTTRLWHMNRAEVLRLGLRNRIALTEAEITAQRNFDPQH